MKRWLLKSFVQALLVMSVSLAACTTTPNQTNRQDLSASQFKQMLDQQTGSTDVVLLDIRTPGEYKSGHIQGAVLVDYYARDFFEELRALDRNKTYLVYCRSGNRSAKSLAIFNRLGFRRVYHLKTGIRGWLEEKYPLAH